MLNTFSVDNRKALVLVVSLAVGAVLIVVCSVFASDSVSGGAPTVATVFLRVLTLALAGGLYAGVLLFYGKRNTAFRENLEKAVNAPMPSPPKKKKKRK